MIISASTDYRAAAKAKLPPFLFHYIDGGSYGEHTLRRNTADLAEIALKQRVLNDMSDLNLETELFGEKLAMPIALAPVGSNGYVRTTWRSPSSKSSRQQGHPFYDVDRIGMPNRRSRT
ncbi:alpha-hydroxy-acid oxidizing protein [Vibrio cyclitrophicus]